MHRVSHGSFWFHSSMVIDEYLKIGFSQGGPRNMREAMLKCFRAGSSQLDITSLLF